MDPGERQYAPANSKSRVPIAAAMLAVSSMLEQINTTSEHARQLLIWQMNSFPSPSEKRIGKSCTHLNGQQYLFGVLP